MKKFAAVTSLALIFGLSGNALAQQPRGGFQGPDLPVMTVAEALKVSDDTPVKLAGKIEKSLGNEKYLFKDATGTITIEIDDDDWRGVTATPDSELIIEGEVDKDMFRDTEIDVDIVTLKK